MFLWALRTLYGDNALIGVGCPVNSQDRPSYDGYSHRGGRALPRKTPMVRRCTVVAGLALMTSVLQPCMTYAKDNGGEPGLVGRVIVIDAGHGGPDGGAQSASGILEKNITLAIAQDAAVYLRQFGAVVYLTRVTDRDFATDADRAAGRRHQGDLRGRLKAIVAHNPDAVVSIHCNAVPSPIWRGATTIYQDDNEAGKHLAYALQNVFKATLLPTKRGPEDMHTLYLLKRLKGPAALAEVGFLSNPDEASFLNQVGYQKRIGNSIAIAVLTYFGEPSSNEGGESPAPSENPTHHSDDAHGHYRHDSSVLDTD